MSQHRFSDDLDAFEIAKEFATHSVSSDDDITLENLNLDQTREMEPVTIPDPAPAALEQPVEAAQAVEAERAVRAKSRKVKDQRTVSQRLWDFAERIFFFAGDRPSEWLRKSVLCLALLGLIGSVSYILNRAVIEPTAESNYTQQLLDFKELAKQGILTEKAKAFKDFPEGITNDLMNAYAENQDLRGWITYLPVDIDLPIVQAKDNDYYLDHNFQKVRSKTGAVFFDYRTPDLKNGFPKNLIVYGHNLSSGLMFSHLNYFIGTPDYMANTGLRYIRNAPLITIQSLYEKAYYKVFAVCVFSADGVQMGDELNYVRFSFASNAEFMDFVEQLRARSVYTFGDVTVDENDCLLMLSTCSYPKKVGFEDSRLVVVARKVRDGESTRVDTSKTVYNKNVIMPRIWYTSNKLPLHPYYTQGTGGAAPGGQTSKPAPSDSGGVSTTAPPQTDPGSSQDTSSNTSPDTSATNPGGSVTQPPSQNTQVPTSTPETSAPQTSESTNTSAGTSATGTQPTETQPTETLATTASSSESPASTDTSTTEQN